MIEAPDRIEPARIDDVSGDLVDLLAETGAKAEALGGKLHPTTAANLAGPVRIMNTYYSNLIEGHNMRPRDIERELAGTGINSWGGRERRSPPGTSHAVC